MTLAPPCGWSSVASRVWHTYGSGGSTICTCAWLHPDHGLFVSATVKVFQLCSMTSSGDSDHTLHNVALLGQMVRVPYHMFSVRVSQLSLLLTGG